MTQVDDLVDSWQEMKFQSLTSLTKNLYVNASEWYWACAAVEVKFENSYTFQFSKVQQIQITI